MESIPSSIYTLIALIILVVLVFGFIIDHLLMKIKETKKNLAHWMYSSEAKDFLLVRAELQNLLPTVRFSMNHDTFGTLTIYSPGEEPKLIQCIRGEDGNIHEVPLK